jgi:ubiquinone/menaquinone biosynthesis C-methylase UbiE
MIEEVKQFYSTFNNGHVLYDCNRELILRINSQGNPLSKRVLDFGCGTGKMLNMIDASERIGIDISSVAINDGLKIYSGIEMIIGDESTLFNYSDQYFDFVYTVSVLDHIPSPEVYGIISNLKRISKELYLMESKDYWQKYCFAHDYENIGFIVDGYEWRSPFTNALYKLYRWEYIPIAEI